MSLPAFDKLLPAFLERASVRKYAEHNFYIWRRIMGGLAFVTANTRSFDPRANYWSLPERRLLIAYFSKNYMARYAPADALRSLAFGVFRHFETARAQGHLGAPLDADLQNRQWADIAARLRETASALPDHSAEYGALKDVWGAKALGGTTLKDSVISFIDATASGISDFEKALWKRVTWFPYIELDSLRELAGAQRFFYGFYGLFGSTNAYHNAGSQTFAPVLQNTDLTRLIEYAKRWAKGETPSETKFLVLGRDDTEPRDCSHYNTVTELYGFLNLPRGPIYNNAAADSYEEFAKAADVGDLPRVLRVGDATRAFLKERPQLVEALVGELRKLASSPDDPNAVTMEGIASQKVAAQRTEDLASQVDGHLRLEQAKHFSAHLDSIGNFEAAAGFLNLLLDAVLYEQNNEKSVTDGATVPGPPDEKKGRSRPPPPPVGKRLALPPSLRPIADEALGLLQAGFHVLLAGAPGTGKTTVAQIIGHAWNQRLAHAPLEISVDTAPKTVVAHSAWATFHTVGGLLPEKDGTFILRHGIFVTETDNKKIWTLRGECFVLDEMNRADLDRCIGDLYPILSRSVASVVPAGLPGVECIRDHEDFRIIATVNDATLDDIVFPISEGLARRFLRIELPGATLQDVSQFVAGDGAANGDRLAAATLALEVLYEAARQSGKLTTTEEGEHLPFGVGYFGPLRAWVAGNLVVATEPDPMVQARRVLLLALRGMARVRGFGTVLKELED